MGCNHFLDVRVNVTDWSDGIEFFHDEESDKRRQMIKDCVTGAIEALPIHRDVTMQVRSIEFVEGSSYSWRVSKS